MTLPAEHVDILVVGGGINGVGIAADAAGRGLKVVLCEQYDLASGTSSKSTKLIHGGLRYLENFEFSLVRTALIEREVLIGQCPHIVKPIRFRLPHQPHLRPKWMIRLGLFLYDHLAFRHTLGLSKTIKMSELSPLKQHLTTCFEYSDAWVDDARLVLFNALLAQQKGATIRPRTRCISAIKHGQLWQVTLQNSEGRRDIMYCRTLVNATGPWAGTLANNLFKPSQPIKMRLSKGSHIVVKRLYESQEAYVLQQLDKRILFVIPYEQDYSLIGTTDEDYQGDPANASMSESELEYILDSVNQYFTRRLKRQDVIYSYTGVRPLIADQHQAPQAVSREYQLVLEGNDHEPVLLNVFGGKLTTYRKLAEQAVNEITQKIGRKLPAWTKHAQLPGSDFTNLEQLTRQLISEFDYLPTSLAQRYSRTYGTMCRQFLHSGKHIGILGEHFGAGLYQAEVDYLVAQEWAHSSEDVLWRRTKLGIRTSAAQQQRLTEYLSNSQAL